ncbi:unnamed protein product [marine sediment metagenome]|uniref:Uncharacterized protein n=1 Tax=marine sediment metagenome TaxID=412755 RepID=X1JF03_9ZZZZ
MTNFEIAYDIGLEELYDKVRMQIWINEELQLQPKSIKETIIRTYQELDR